jgi:hypothetical protein
MLSEIECESLMHEKTSFHCQETERVDAHPALNNKVGAEYRDWFRPKVISLTGNIYNQSRPMKLIDVNLACDSLSEFIGP